MNETHHSSHIYGGLIENFFQTGWMGLTSVLVTPNIDTYLPPRTTSWLSSLQVPCIHKNIVSVICFKIVFIEARVSVSCYSPSGLTFFFPLIGDNREYSGAFKQKKVSLERKGKTLAFCPSSKDVPFKSKFHIGGNG